MTLAGLAIALSGVGILVTGALAFAFLRDPVAGLEQTTHRAEKLPEVMTDRYIAFTILALGATVYGDLKVIALLFASFAFMGFADAWIYARGSFPLPSTCWRALRRQWLLSWRFWRCSRRHKNV